MNVTIVDYNSGNISSVINSFQEVAKDRVSKGGVVREPQYHIDAIESVIDAARNYQSYIKNLTASPLEGPAGNHEYLAWMCRREDSNPIVDSAYIEKLVNDTL